MAHATSLAQAAGQAFDNLNIHFQASQLKGTLALFAQATINIFPEADVNSHPVSNWITVIAALADQMPATNIPLEQLTESAEFVYRLCWMASFLQTTSPQQITNAQATALLGFYNTVIGF